MSPAILVPALVSALQDGFRMARAEARQWAEWAVANPHAAALQLNKMAHQVDHRARVLRARKVVLWRRAHRLTRLTSAAIALRAIAKDLDPLLERCT